MVVPAYRSSRVLGLQNQGRSGEGNDNGVEENNARNQRRVENLRASFASMHNSAASDDDDEKETRPARQTRRLSSSLVDALSDKDSPLAKFLLTGNKGRGDDGDDDEEGWFDNAMMKSVRNGFTRFVTGEDEVNEVGSLGTNKAWFYSLALEPMEVRRDRTIMLAEAYAIFGALFLAGTWVLYEWGSGYGYGGCRFEETEYCSPAVDRAFEVVMALMITANIFQAMFSSFLWLMSILFSATHRDWVYGARNLLVLCHTLLLCIFVFTLLGVGLGIYAKLAPYWPEVGIALAFLLIVVLYGMWALSNLVAEQASLEYYHFPFWFRWIFLPFPMLKRGGRQKIRQNAEIRAKEVKARATTERTLSKPTSKSKRSAPQSGVGLLLRRSADAIGRRKFDVSKYERLLEEDWYCEEDELRNMSVTDLSKYMPRRLAEEVHRQLALNGKVRTSHIASGSLDDQRRVSWNMKEDSD